MKKRKTLTIVIGIIIGLIIIGAFAWYKGYGNSSSPLTSQSATTKSFTLQELAQYDGTDPTKPIYLGMNGYVYDVTSGKKFYEKGGSYNWLAGKDSSKDLNLIGGDIIKRKYPVIGKLVQ
jgi:predicted heme/steroid binding protein